MIIIVLVFISFYINSFSFLFSFSFGFLSSSRSHFRERLPNHFRSSFSFVHENNTVAQGPYMVARAGFEPATLRTNGNESANVPPRPTNDINRYHRFKIHSLFVNSQ